MKNNIRSLRLINVGGWRKDHFKDFEVVGTCSQNFCSLGSNFWIKILLVTCTSQKDKRKMAFYVHILSAEKLKDIGQVFLIICAFTLGNHKIPVLSHGGTPKKFFISPLFSIFLRQFHSQFEIHLEIMTPRATNEWITRQGH